MLDTTLYRIAGKICMVQIFALFRGWLATAKIKTAKFKMCVLGLNTEKRKFLLEMIQAKAKQEEKNDVVSQ